VRNESHETDPTVLPNTPEPHPQNHHPPRAPEPPTRVRTRAKRLPGVLILTPGSKALDREAIQRLYNRELLTPIERAKAIARWSKLYKAVA
jgi:hypothetical protein